MVSFTTQEPIIPMYDEPELEAGDGADTRYTAVLLFLTVMLVLGLLWGTKAVKTTVYTHNILAPLWVAYNEETGKVKDYMQVYGVDPHSYKPEVRRPTIVKRILEYNADIVCLQEVQVSETNYLLQKLPKYELVHWAWHEQGIWSSWLADYQKPDSSYRNGNVFFVKRKLLKNFHVVGRTIRTSSDGWNAGILTLRHKSWLRNVFRGPIQIANVHLAHPTEKTANAVAQSRILNREMESVGGRFIVAGDLNVMATEPLYKKYTQDWGYTDQGEVFDQKGVTCTTHFTEEKGLAKLQRIDYFMTKDVAVTGMRYLAPKLSNVQEALNYCGSDHLPLFLEGLF